MFFTDIMPKAQMRDLVSGNVFSNNFSRPRLPCLFHNMFEHNDNSIIVWQRSAIAAKSPPLLRRKGIIISVVYYWRAQVPKPFYNRWPKKLALVHPYEIGIFLPDFAHDPVVKEHT